jgi:glycosyltransferase involved in cell wall biosynthesis
MQIIHILLGKANPERMNGVNKVAHQMATAQTEHGLDVTICGLTTDKTETKPRPYKLVLIRQKSRTFFLTNELRNFIDQLSMDAIVHFHGVLIPIFFSIARKLKQKNISYVITPHGALQDMPLQRRKLLKMPYLLLFEKHFLNNARKIQALTTHEQSALNRQTISKTIHIPNAYPYQPYIKQPPDNQEIIFGYIGRFDKRHKGLDALIAGFHEFYQIHREGYLWLTGDGRDRSYLEKQVKLFDLSNRVIFKGEHHAQSKQDLLNQINAFILPSRWDTMPVAVLEAAANQIPLIVTKAAGYEEAINRWQSGIILQNTDPVEIAAGMANFLGRHRNDTLEITGKNAENMVKEEFIWSKVIHQVISGLYQS